jgi:Mannosyl-glycoprotein endo-beta-N-acetylglucosaminidase
MEIVTPSAGYVVYGEKCKSARLAAVYYRNLTWQRQLARGGQLADSTPIVKGKTCRWARFTAIEWMARARSARRALERWRREEGQIVQRLERAMSGSPMAGSGAELVRIARSYHVSPYFIIAVAATESSIGRAACGYAGRNVWGLGNCGSAWSVPSFATWADAYDYYARFLNRQWPGHSSPYSFRGYAACDDCWARKVSSWMSSLFGVEARTTYP